MKKILYLIFFFSLLGYSQVPDRFRDGIDTPFVRLGILTTTERDAITIPANKSMILYNSTDNEFQFYDVDSSTWKAVGDGSGSSTMATTSFSPYLSLTSTNGQDAIEDLYQRLLLDTYDFTW